MNRRRFLGAAAASAVCAAFTARAAGRSPAQEAAELSVLSEGFRRAQRAGKPLLVLVIPADEAKRYERGTAFGEYLNHGSAEQIAPLALCEVVCAELVHLQRLVPAAAGSGDPLLVLVETDQVPARARRLEGNVPADPHGRGLMLDDEPRKKGETDEQHWRRLYEKQQRQEDQRVSARIALLAALVREAVQPSPELLERRAQQVRAHSGGGLGAGQLEVDLARGAPLTLEQVGAAAALVAQQAARAEPGRRAALLGQLAEVARARLVKARVPGSRWAVSSGCGTRVEGEEDRSLMVSCGMGHVPAKSARFLYFFANNRAL